VECIEINTRTNLFWFVDDRIEKIRPKYERFNLSMHSGISMPFRGNEQFTKMKLELLRSEIIACSMIGAKELIFHLHHDKLSENEAVRIREIIDFAKSKGVDMVYESNGVCVAEIALDFLKRFPDVGYNLDLGHLNNGHGRGMLGCPIDEFLKDLKDRTVYIHAHGNNGKKDQHLALRKGTLDWKHVFDVLDMSNVRKVISETNDKEDAEMNLEDLNEYFGQDGLKSI